MQLAQIMFERIHEKIIAFRQRITLSNKKLVALIIILLTVIALPLMVIVSQQKQDIRQRASELEPSITTINNVKDDADIKFAPGEILVKFKTTIPPLTVREEKISQGVDLERNTASIPDIETDTLPSILETVNQTYKIKTVEKAFKQTEEDVTQALDTASKVNQTDLSRIYKLKLGSTAPIEQIIEELKKDPNVEYAEPNYIMHTQEVPNDHYYPQMWNLQKINIEKAWNITKGLDDITVAVVDTGIDYTHPDLGGCLGSTCRISGGYDFVNNDNDPKDDYGHGTHVAGTIGALVNNNIGISGINWNAKLMAVKVLDNNGSGDIEDIAKGIAYSADNGARIINMSLGGNISCNNTKIIQDTISYANGKGITVVVAAGNSSKDADEFSPASCNDVIAVGATGPTDERSFYSNYGYTIDLTAPGGDNTKCSDNSSCLINSTYPGNSYKFLQGTSMAAPHAAGVAALVLAKNPTLTPNQIENILENSAFDLGDIGFDTNYGFGRIDADKALSEMNTRSTIKPLIDLPTNMRIGSSLEIKGTANGEGFSSYTLEYATADNPTNWQSQDIKLVSNGSAPVAKGVLGTWNIPRLQGERIYLLKLTINTKDNEKTSVIKRLIYDPKIKSGWPFLLKKNLGSIYDPIVPTISDLNGDNKKEIIFFRMTRGYALKENAVIYPGWQQYIIGDYSFEKIIYLPITKDINSSYAGKEILFGYFHPDGIAIRGVETQTGLNSVLFDKSIPAKIGSIYTSLTTFQESDGTINIITISLDKDAHRIYKLNNKGQILSGWPVIPVSKVIPIPGSKLFDLPARIVVGNVVNTEEQNIIVSYGKPTNLEDEKIAVLKSTGQVVTAWKVHGHRSANVLLGDVDGDGIKEIITDGISSKNTVEINIYKGDGTKIATFDTNSSDRAGFVLADFNNDGKIDIFIDNNHGSLNVIDGTGSVIAQGSDSYPLERPYLRDHQDDEPRPSRYGVDIEYFDAVVGDLNADGKKDIVKQGKTSGNKFGYYFYTVDGSQIKTDTFQSLSLNKEVFSSVSIDDIDNDGKAEIIFTDDYDTDFALYVVALNINLTSLDWSQYLHDEYHTGAGHASTPVLVPTPTPTPTSTPTPTPKPKPTPTPTPFPTKNISVLNKGSFPLTILNVSDVSINFAWGDIGKNYKYTLEYFYGNENTKYNTNNTLSLSPVTAPPLNGQFKSTVNLSTQRNMHMRMKACGGRSASTTACLFSDELFISTK